MHEWRERLQRWFTPMARRTPLSPNAISLLALGANIGAAILLYRGWFISAVFVIAIAGLADAFDGIVARVQDKASLYGDFLDHVADRVSDVLLAAGWMLGSNVAPMIVLAGVILVMLNGYIGTQIEATWGTRRYDTMGRGEFVLALIVFPIGSSIMATNGWDSIALGPLRIAEWMSMLLIAAALFAIAQRFALAARVERE